MRLINTTTLALESFISCEDQEYAILSHTWGPGEVILEDMTDLVKASTKPGFAKIEETCRLAREYGLQYAWVDTCCIDKSSSAELSEAINSMFQWYKSSKVCFTFLSDFSEDANANDGLKKCRWFTRGWTLQELVASPIINFYDEVWGFRGTKISLQEPLSRITYIDVEVLRDSDLISTVPVGRRMSWAATRQTTRTEDRAYSLFGLFDVNLPLIYGEGAKAFIRLQEAIALSNDLSLFAWTAEDGDDQVLRGLFAKSPSEYDQCRTLVRDMDPMVAPIDCMMVNQDFRLRVSKDWNKTDNGDLAYGSLYLQCIAVKKRPIQNLPDISRPIAIYLLKTAHGHIRYRPRERSKYFRSTTSAQVTIHVPKYINPIQSKALAQQLSHNFGFDLRNESGYNFSIVFYPKHLYDDRSQVFITNGYPKFTGMIIMERLPNHDNGSDMSLEKIKHIVIFGLQVDKRSSETRKVAGVQALKPWATFYDFEKPDEVSDALHSASDSQISDCLNEVSNIMRTSISEQEGMPTLLKQLSRTKFTNSVKKVGHITFEVSVEVNEAAKSSAMCLYNLIVTVRGEEEEEEEEEVAELEAEIYESIISPQATKFWKRGLSSIHNARA